MAEVVVAAVEEVGVAAVAEPEEKALEEEEAKAEVVEVEAEAEKKEEATVTEEKMEEVNMKEPEEEEDEVLEEKKEPQESKVAESVTNNEPEAEDQVEEDNPAGKFMLLDRLSKFIRQEDKPLNAVLSGYFAKLFTLLINRKQKSLLPYVFSPESDFIESLLYHVYQKSLSELITKFLNIQEESTRFDENIAKLVKAKQVQILDTLVEKLGPDSSEEDNLNASSIL